MNIDDQRPTNDRPTSVLRANSHILQKFQTAITLQRVNRPTVTNWSQSKVFLVGYCHCCWGDSFQKGLRLHRLKSSSSGMKYGRIVLQLNTHWLVEPDFWYDIILARWRPWHHCISKLVVADCLQFLIHSTFILVCLTGHFFQSYSRSGVVTQKLTMMEQHFLHHQSSSYIHLTKGWQTATQSSHITLNKKSKIESKLSRVICPDWLFGRDFLIRMLHKGCY